MVLVTGVPTTQPPCWHYLTPQTTKPIFQIKHVYYPALKASENNNKTVGKL